MRLIDADRLKAIISNTYYKPHEVIGIINSRPTVKAIPIEWLKKYMDKIDIEDSGMVYLSPSGSFRDMLKKWEKENESRDTESTK